MDLELDDGMLEETTSEKTTDDRSKEEYNHTNNDNSNVINECDDEVIIAMKPVKTSPIKLTVTNEDYAIPKDYTNDKCREKTGDGLRSFGYIAVRSKTRACYVTLPLLPLTGLCFTTMRK